MPPARSFDRHGDAAPSSPVVVSVPHAGRDYPLALRQALRVPVEALVALEDRHADALALASHGGETLFVQRPARAWIDLNRAETERDPRIDGGAPPQTVAKRSAKVLGGLGLVPRRIGRSGDIWARRLSGDEVVARIVADHRPYHAALTATLAEARARFGIAVLLDLHSMPSLPGADAAAIVIGDRFGRSASARLVARVEGAARTVGLRTALNSPYAGGHIVDRHGDPARGIHALQIEFDRALYLDAALDRPGDGFAAAAALLRRIVAALTDEAFAMVDALAAE